MSHRIKLKHKYGLDNLIKIVNYLNIYFSLKRSFKISFGLGYFPPPFYS